MSDQLALERYEYRIVDRDGRAHQWIERIEVTARSLARYLDTLHAEKGDKYARGPHRIERRRVAAWETVA